MLGQSEDSADCPGSEGHDLLNTGLDGGPGTKQNTHITLVFLLSSQDRSSRTLSSSHRGGAGVAVCLLGYHAGAGRVAQRAR